MNLNQIIEALSPSKLQGKFVDPDKCLEEIRSIQRRHHHRYPMGHLLDSELRVGAEELQDRMDRLVELTEALDNWLKSGGFKPRDWRTPL